MLSLAVVLVASELFGARGIGCAMRSAGLGPVRVELTTNTSAPELYAPAMLGTENGTCARFSAQTADGERIDARLFQRKRLYVETGGLGGLRCDKTASVCKMNLIAGCQRLIRPCPVAGPAIIDKRHNFHCIRTRTTSADDTSTKGFRGRLIWARGLPENVPIARQR